MFILLYYIILILFYVDTYYQKCFITTYRSFTSPEKLFSKLVQRYNVPISKNVQVDQRQVKVRVAIILKYWFETQIRDFDDMVSTNNILLLLFLLEFYIYFNLYS